MPDSAASDQNQPLKNYRTERHKRMKTIAKILGLPMISGTGLAFSIKFLLSGDFLLGAGLILASVGVAFLAIFWKAVTEFGESILDEIERRLDEKTKSTAVWVVDGLENIVVGVWWRFTSKFRLDYYKQLIFKTRNYETKGLKTKTEFNLDLEKVFVPLEIAPESPQKATADIVPRVPRNPLKDGKDIWDFLVSIYDTDCRARSLAILGAPGSGKTTLLRYVTFTYAKRQQRKQHRKAPTLVPFLVFLRDLFRQDQTPPNFKSLGLLDLLLQQKQIAKLQPKRQETQWLKNQLENGTALVMIDGLDEVPEEQRKIVGEWLDQQIADYPSAVFLITSRPYGYKHNPLENVEAVLEAQPFTQSQRRQFIESWYLQREIKAHSGVDDEGVRDEAREQSEDLIARINANRNIAAIARNPLLLTMIATVHCFRGALPGRRVELYDEICDVLLGRRQAAKKIFDPLTVEQKKSVLQVLALKMMLAETLEFRLAEADQWIATRLGNVCQSQMSTAEFIQLVKDQVGLIVEKEQGIYAFAHKTFQEYLAAVQIEKNQEIGLLAGNMGYEWWAETTRLFSATSEDATLLITQALHAGTIEALQLAADCLEEGLNIDGTVRRQFEEKIEADLSSENPVAFSLAAQFLLNRRLANGFTSFGNDLEIDETYITNAEYELFEIKVNRGRVREREAPPLQESRNISKQNMQRFCAWLSWRDVGLLREERVAYLPTGIHKELVDEQTNNLPLVAEGKLKLIRYQLPEIYSKLAFKLATKAWQDADKETWNVMLKVANCESKGYLDIEDIQQFPCEDLRMIDRLWVWYSSGKFGFSIQKQIWIDCGGIPGKYEREPYMKFATKVDWYRKEWRSYGDLDFGDGVQGHLPSLYHGRWDTGVSLLSRRDL